MDHGFVDRQEAGQRLAQRVQQHLGPAVNPADLVVLGLPRGGLPVAAEVAKALGAPLDVVLVRKIGTPLNPELALGAVAGPEGRFETLNTELVARLGLTRAAIDLLAAAPKAELSRRARLWGAGPVAKAVQGKQVIVVDDGMATGATMRAALAALRAEGAARVLVALPVAAPDSLATLVGLADAVICLQSPDHFEAVGAHYASFPQVSDAEVRDILAAFRRPAPSKGDVP